MTEKRFEERYEGEIIVSVKDNVNDKNINIKEMVDLLNELHEENEHYKALFVEIVETALTDRNCRELYCKGILNIFEKANSLNQARDMIRGHLE